ncbi:MAG: PIG-L deacetylase family protein [Polyangiaceae bacterium]
MKILAIGAHPDDIEFGCAGAILNWVDEGHDVSVLVMTPGDRGGDPAVRKREQKKAAALMGVKKVYWGTFSDTQLTQNINAMIVEIEKVVAKVKPDYALFNSAEDGHQDHRALNKAAVTATRWVKNVAFFEVPSSQNFFPTLFADITKNFDQKMKALLAHRSQHLKTHIQGLSITDAARATAVFRGVQSRVRFAEGFIPLRLFIGA